VEKKHGYAPILRERNKSFEELKNLAKDGLCYHWGRNEKHAVAKNMEIAGEDYKVYVNVVEAYMDKHMCKIELVFNTNGENMRSYNPGKACDVLSFIVTAFATGKVFYNVGYNIFKSGWGYVHKENAIAEFKYSAAHEIGHEILQMAMNSYYSYTHKGSSTLTTQKLKGENRFDEEDEKKEIDLMLYYKNYFRYNNNDYKRIVAAKDDVLGLIGLIKVDTK